MKKEIYRGDIFYARLFGAIGSEQKGTRPVLIIQNNIGNKFSSTTIIAPLTKKIETSQPTHIQIKACGNLKYDSTILAEQIRTIDKYRIERKIATLSSEIMKKVDKAILIAQGLENIKNQKISLVNKLIFFIEGGKK